MSEAKSELPVISKLDPEQRAQVISGSKCSKVIRHELQQQISKLKEQNGKVPKLAVVLVGARKDSQTYVRMKTKACEEVGIISEQHDIPAAVTEAELLDLVTKLNEDVTVNGILIQLPLPDHINEKTIIEAVDPNKDADGLHTVNAGKLMSDGLQAPLIPCTPKGCVELLQRYEVPIEGKKAVVIGRSKLVGKPVALLLLSLNATVTICHSRTQNLPDVVKEADIVVAAIGKAQFVKSEWLKDGVVVIDVGINAVDDASRPRGYRLVGDVDYKPSKPVASGITPVPGGVGPMTVAMLLGNTLRAFKAQNNIA